MYTYTYMYIYMCMCMCISIMCMCMCTVYVYVHVHVWVYVYVYMYVYVHFLSCCARTLACSSPDEDSFRGTQKPNTRRSLNGSLASSANPSRTTLGSVGFTAFGVLG